WQNFRKFWKEILLGIRDVGEEGAQTLNHDLRWTLRGSDLEFDLAVFDDIPQSATSQLFVQFEGRDELVVPLSRVALGRFQGIAHNAEPGVVHVRGGVGPKKFGPVAIELSPLLFSDSRGLPVQMNALSQLARQTNGVVNNVPPISSISNAVLYERWPMAEWVLEFCAFLLLLADLVLRVIKIPKFSMIIRKLPNRGSLVTRMS
ncbi:MAG: hypothetical protein KDD60_05880, partial [Bdellovibrionales bacterium]|nr:hypothetical protein [Bdellovibrionales bacterium]